jgi:hypothetical protein
MEDKLDDLRRRLDEKTTEIEAFIAREQGMGDIRATSPADYEQLQRDVEELLEQWEEAAPEEGYGTPEDSQLDKLISERFEIEQKILVVSGGRPRVTILTVASSKTRRHFLKANARINYRSFSLLPSTGPR